MRLLALMTGALVLAGVAHAQDAAKPNPLDTIPDAMPFDLPFGAPIGVDQANRSSPQPRWKRRSTIGR